MVMPEQHLQEAIVGCLLCSPHDIDLVASQLDPSDFDNQKCRVVYEHMLTNEGGSDLITTTAAMAGKVKPDELVSWMAHEIIPAFLPRYCRELKELTQRRRLCDALGTIRLMASTSTTAEMLERIDAEISALTKAKIDDPTPSSVLVVEAARRLKARKETRGQIQGIPYGIAALDAATCGMHKGELIVVAGRPSMGKSAFAGNILENVCRAGKSGILFSLEMDNGNCVDRMLSSAGRLPYQRLRSGMLQDADWARLSRASNELHSFRMFMDDTAGISLREIKTKCRKLKRDGLDVVVIDYLQLMSTNASLNNRVQAIGEISRGLKQMARELECSVVLLSQLNRAVDSRTDKRPTMSDLRDSGEIEQDADVILFPFREAAYCQKCKDGVDDGSHDLKAHKSKAEIIIEKQRNGERNISVPVVWMGDIQKFVDGGVV